jgi:iron complex transport system permease protein
VTLPPNVVIKVLIDGISGQSSIDPFQSAIVMHARLPRTLLATLCGAGLAMSGAVLQGAFRNPLVGPQTIGALTGAGFGGSLMLFFALGQIAVMSGAFVVGLLATLAVVWLARTAGQSSILMLVLAGIVVASLMAAFTTMLRFLADPELELPQLVYWLMGSFSASGLPEFFTIALPVLGGMMVLFGYAFRLNVLASGEEEARALGLNIVRDRTILLVAVAIIAAAAVSVAGIIGWVGLVVPHIARMLVGPDHRLLLPASALIGAAYLTLIDTIARSATAAELPIGALSAILGAPVFIVVLHKTRAQGWRYD